MDTRSDRRNGAMGITEEVPWWMRHPAWLLVFIWLVLCLKWLRGSRTIPYDATQQFFPAISFAARQLRELQWPWWNPFLFGGYPQLADPQMMTFQPTLVLPMMLAPTSQHLFGIVVVMHVLLAGIGAIQLARHYLWRPPVQLLFALTWMFGGVMASRLQHTPMIVSMAMLPWLWLCLSRMNSLRRSRDAVYAGIWGGLIALQLTQVTYFIVLACIVHAAGAILLERASRLRVATRFVCVGLVAAIISSPQWLSTLAYLPHTSRFELGLADSGAGSLEWRSLLTLLSGNFFEQGSGQYWGGGDPTQDYLYLGAVPLAIWLFWGAAAAVHDRRRVSLALGVLVFAILFALGTHAPLYPALHGWFPGMNLFRRPADMLFLATPALAWLAAAALQARLDGARAQPHWPSIVGIVTLLMYGIWIALVEDPHPRALLSSLGSVGLGMAAVLLLLVHGRRPAPAWPLVLLVALVALDYRVFNIAQAFNAGPRIQSAKMVAGTLEGLFAQPERSVPGSAIPLRAEIHGVPELLNGAVIPRLPLINGYNPMYVSRYARMSGIGGYPTPSPDERGTTDWASDPDAALWDLLGLRVTIASEAFTGSVYAAEAGFHVRTREVRLPRVLNPREIRRHTDDLPDATAFSTTDFGRVLWLPQSSEPVPCPETGAASAKVERIRYQANVIELDYQAPAPAWLVVNEVIAPGWRAEVDGLPVPLSRGNGLFRAVCVPAGRSRLSLRFSPLQLWRDGWAEWRAGAPRS